MREYCYNCFAQLREETDHCSHCGFDASQYAAESHHLLPGTVLRERYQVGRVLGEGGFGITYIGIDTVLNLKVAVKEFYMSGYVSRNNTISTTIQANVGNHTEIFEKNRERFLQEARVLAKFFSEPGIVSVIDFFRENNTAYIVMEFLDGVTLKDYLGNAGKLSWERTMSLMNPILDSMSRIHAYNVIHRDISPDNIMVTGNGQVKLLDFGAAREFSQGDVKSLSVILKPGYAPLEQYRSRGVQGPWTDVYALCATIYRCLTGIVPDDAMDRVYDDPIRTPAELGDCPAAISDVLMKGLAVRQEERWSSVDELCEALRQAENAPVAAPAPTMSERADATVFARAESLTPAAELNSFVPAGDADATVYSGERGAASMLGRAADIRWNSEPRPAYEPGPSYANVTRVKADAVPEKKSRPNRFAAFLIGLFAAADLAILAWGVLLIMIH